MSVWLSNLVKNVGVLLVSGKRSKDTMGKLFRLTYIGFSINPSIFSMLNWLYSENLINFLCQSHDFCFIRWQDSHQSGC